MIRRLLLLSLCLDPLHLTAAQRHVGPNQAHRSIREAVQAAAPGDSIVVHSGRFEEPQIQIDKPLQLLGLGRPVIDGLSRGTVIAVSATDVAVRGFVIRNGGRSSTNDLAGIRVESAARVTVEDNDVRNCQFAIYLARARDCAILRNTIEGVPDGEQNSGNGIHLWNCEGIQVAANRVRGHRDGIYIEFASRSKVEDNVVVNNLRYGLHFMTAHDSVFHANRFGANGAGVAVMYSHGVDMNDNLFEDSRGEASYGMLLKDITDSRVRGNTFRRNSTGVCAQGATRVAFARNEFRDNGWALRILANGADNAFRENNFRGNSFDIGTNGDLADHRFERNYWDRYEGHDLNRDGVGDVPFRPVGLFSMLVERQPASALLMRSLVMHLLDRAERALPSITPTGVLDTAPSCRPNPVSTPTAAGIATSTEP